MGRVFFFLLLALAVYVAWQWLRRSSSQGAPPPRQNPAVPQAMVSCSHCGLHVPRTDALPSGERFYCSEEHRQRGPSA